MEMGTEKLSKPIKYRHRATGALLAEQVYGEPFLRWVYETRAGRLALHALVKRAWFSRWYGWRMRRPSSRKRIGPFIKAYNIDMDEAAAPADSYESFDAFFVRKLKPGARPVADADVVFPADGRHLGFPDVSRVSGIFMKGQEFDIPALLRDQTLAGRYARGTAVISRLCPVDYHRFHFPVTGTPGETRRISGSLRSVNPIALRQDIRILWENKRTVTEIVTEKLGVVLMLEIGATCVGSIEQTYVPGRPVRKGEEKGCFHFGGSTTLLLFEPGMVKLDSDLLEATAAGTELYAKMGESLART
jgi:phosphatidylserine decarboxylase